MKPVRGRPRSRANSPRKWCASASASSGRSRSGGSGIADHVQAEVEVLAEASRADRHLEILVRRGDDAHVGPDGARAAQPLELLILEHPQELRLRRGRHVADLVEEERAAVRLLEAPDARAVGAREGAALVTEELGLEQRLGQRRAVHLHERRLRAAREAVHQSGDDLLPGAGLSGHEHRRPRRGHAARQLDGGPQRGARSDHAIGREAGDAFGAQRRHLAQQPAMRGGLADAGLELLEVERLLHEIERAEPHRLDGGLDAAERGHQDDARALVPVARSAEDFDSVCARETQIGDDHVVRLAGPVGETLDGAFPAGLLVHLGEPLAERARDAAAQGVAVLDDEDPRPDGRPRRRHAPAPGPPSGRRRRKRAPRPREGSRARLPPCEATTFCAMASPTPDPRCFVVKNG